LKDGTRKRMKKLLFGLTIAAAALLLTGCDSLFSTDNTIVVEVVNSPTFDGGKLLVMVCDQSSFDPLNPIPVGASNPLFDQNVKNGFGHAPVWDVATALLSPYYATAGTTYEVVVGIDMDDNQSFFDSGVDYILTVYTGLPFSNPLTFTGTVTKTYTEADFIITP
jgi:hypothetical protein